MVISFSELFRFVLYLAVFDLALFVLWLVFGGDILYKIAIESPPASLMPGVFVGVLWIRAKLYEKWDRTDQTA